METQDFIDVEAFEQDKGIYYIDNLPRGIYELNGERVHLSGYNGKIILDLDQEVNLFKINTTKVIDYYIDSEGNNLSEVEYSKQKSELIKNTYEDSNYEMSFNDLDEEYAYKKFIQKWKEVYKQITTHKRVTFDIQHTMYNLPKYITHTRKLNGDLKNTLYTYNEGLHIIDLVTKYLTDLGYNKVSHEPRQKNEFNIHSPNEYIRFSKIGTEYMTICIKGLKKYEERKVAKGTYQDIINKYNSNIKDIKEAIDFWQVSNTKLNEISVKKVYDELTSMRDSLLKIETKVKSSSTKSSLINRINKFMEELKTETLKEK